MIATQCPTQDTLHALSTGRLEESQSEPLLDHLRDCQRCRAELETLQNAEDSVIALLRQPDDVREYDAEPDCKRALAKALGALAIAGDAVTHSDWQQLPETIGEYEIVRPLGRGGMGRVFLARHSKLGRQVALKLALIDRLADPRVRRRFEAEMRAVGKLSHPNIVTAHDAREIDGTAVLVTEYIEGLDLAQLVRRTGPLATADASEIICRVAAALQYTADEGFVHRDIKPSNIMLSSDGQVKLLDLGLARFHSGEDAAEMTGTGQAMGTADYVAPEQVTDGRSVDVRADIYSLGCTLFHLLTGGPPFSHEDYPTAFAKMNAHVSTPPPSLASRRNDCPADVARLVDAMLAKQPDRRPARPIDVASRLEKHAAGADLQALAARAAELPPGAQAEAAPRPSSAARPQSLPWMRRKIPATLAIATGLFGFLAGLALGIIITITRPDGSKVVVTAPEGSDIDIRDAEAAVAPEPGVAAHRDPSGVATPDTQSPLEESPLALAVLLKPDEADIRSLSLWTRRTRQSPDKIENAKTERGTWYPVDENVAFHPDTRSVPGRGRFRLISENRGAVLRWSELLEYGIGIAAAEVHGNSKNISGWPRRLKIYFRPPISRPSDRQRLGAHQALAILSFGKIIAVANVAEGRISEIEVTSVFNDEMLRRLFVAVGVGHSNDPRAADLSPFPAREAPDGIWIAESTDDAQEEIDRRFSAVALKRGRYYAVYHDLAAHAGSLHRNPTGPSSVTFQPNDSKFDPVVGVYRFPERGTLQIATYDPNGSDPPRSVDSEAASTQKLRKVSEFPNSLEQLADVAAKQDEHVGPAILKLLEIPELRTVLNRDAPTSQLPENDNDTRSAEAVPASTKPPVAEKASDPFGAAVAPATSAAFNRYQGYWRVQSSRGTSSRQTKESPDNRIDHVVVERGRLHLLQDNKMVASGRLEPGQAAEGFVFHDEIGGVSVTGKLYRADPFGDPFGGADPFGEPGLRLQLSDFENLANVPASRLNDYPLILPMTVILSPLTGSAAAAVEAVLREQRSSVERSDDGEAPTSQRPETAATLADSPLALAVLVGPVRVTEVRRLEAAKQELQRNRESGLVKTELGTWYPIDGDFEVPIEATRDGQRYTLVADGRENQIAWTELYGNLRLQVGQARSESRLEFHFGGELPQRIGEMTRRNLNRRLALLIDGRIVAAPTIRGEFRDLAVFTGTFTDEQQSLLQTALKAFFPASRSKGPTEDDMLRQLQGVWLPVPTPDAPPAASIPIIAFQGDRFFHARADGQELNRGTIRLDELNQSSESVRLIWTVTDAGVRGRNSSPPPVPLEAMHMDLRFLSASVLQMLPQVPGGEPVGFDDADPGSDHLRTLTRIGDVPQTPADLAALQVGRPPEVAQALEHVLYMLQKNVTPP